MKHKTLTILIFLSYLYTQNIGLNKKISFDSHHTTFKIFSDSLYYIVSNMADKEHSKKSGIIGVIDKIGNVKNLVKLGKTNNYILSGTKLKNGGFLFVGYNKENNDEWNQIYVVKTNQEFNIIWENSYELLNNDSKGYAIIELNDKEYWILGHTKTSKNGALILKIDDQGNEKWFSYLPNLKCNFANNMTVLNDTEFIISGQNENQLFVAKIDKKGEILWQYNYFDDTKYHRAYDIKKTNDNAIILVGNSTKTENHSFDVLMIKLSQDGKEKWVKKFGNEKNEVARDIKQNKKSEYIISGYALVDKKEKTYDSFIIKTDSMGNKITRLDFNLMASNQLLDLNIEYNEKTNIESYVGAGNIFNEDGKSEIWFVKFSID